MQPSSVGAAGGGIAGPATLVSTATSSTLPTRRPFLYIGQLSPQVNEVLLREIFSACGTVLSSKIVSDRSVQHPGAYNYGFVEYADVEAAENALKTLNGRKIIDSDIRVDWAASSLTMGGDSFGSAATTRDNTSTHFHVFVGDLAPEVNDSMLHQAFQSFVTISEARVMWDVTSGKSRGYGFVAFRDRSDAEQAIATMNGEWLGSRTIRVNWANQKSSGNTLSTTGLPQEVNVLGHGMIPQPRSTPVATALGGIRVLGLGSTSMPPTGGAASGTPITYEQALQSSAPQNTTVYVGNIPPVATQNDLIPLFTQYGYIIEIRMQAERGFAFVKLDTHENAANAIVNLAGQIACGRPIKCGWGKDRSESAMFNALRQQVQPLSAYGNIAPPQAMFGVPQYGFPNTFAAFPPTNVETAQAQIASVGAPLDTAVLQQLQAAQVQAVQLHAQQQQQQQQQQLQLQQYAANMGSAQHVQQGSVQQHQQQQQKDGNLGSSVYSRPSG